MSNKYTPLDSTEDSYSIQETVPPSYELDEITPGSANCNDHVYGPPQPLQVSFHTDDYNIIHLKLNYYPHRGVDGIHQIIRTKLNSMDIDLGDEVYLIGEWEGLKFRLILIDEDSVGDKIHYFKAREQLSIETTWGWFDFVGVVVVLIFFIILVVLFYFLMLFLARRN